MSTRPAGCVHAPVGSPTTPIRIHPLNSLINFSIREHLVAFARYIYATLFNMDTMSRSQYPIPKPATLARGQIARWPGCQKKLFRRQHRIGKSISIGERTCPSDSIILSNYKPTRQTCQINHLLEKHPYIDTVLIQRHKSMSILQPHPIPFPSFACTFPSHFRDARSRFSQYSLPTLSAFLPFWSCFPRRRKSLGDLYTLPELNGKTTIQARSSNTGGERRCDIR